MKKMIIVVIVLATGIALAGCGFRSKPEQQQDPTLPAWIFTPEVDDGLSAASCVNVAVGSYGMQKDLAISQANRQLALTLGNQMQSYLSNYDRAIVTEEDGHAPGAFYERVSREVINEKMVGCDLINAGYYNMEDNRQFCVAVAIGQKSVMEMVKAAESAAGIEADPITKGQLREKYFSDEALKKLDQQIENSIDP